MLPVPRLDRQKKDPGAKLGIALHISVSAAFGAIVLGAWGLGGVHGVSSAPLPPNLELRSTFLTKWADEFAACAW